MTRRPRLAATDTHICLKCGRGIYASQEWFVGDDCARKLGPQKVEALRIYAVQEADPFTIPAGQRPASLQARINNHNARAAADPSIATLCRHDSEVGRCGACRYEGKAENASKRILREICAQPREQRQAERTALQGSRAGALTPARRPVRRPAARREHEAAEPASAAATQIALM
ncbi:hypothetical protein ABT299_11745 [Spirillospora sp. NPDC000708]